MPNGRGRKKYDAEMQFWRGPVLAKSMAVAAPLGHPAKLKYRLWFT